MAPRIAPQGACLSVRGTSPAGPSTPVALAVHAGYEFIPPTIPAPALEESLAEKLAAWRRRRKLRDLYDLDLFGRGALDEPQIRRLLVLRVWHDVIDDLASLDSDAYGARLVVRSYSWAVLDPCGPRADERRRGYRALAQSERLTSRRSLTDALRTRSKLDANRVVSAATRVPACELRPASADASPKGFHGSSTAGSRWLQCAHDQSRRGCAEAREAPLLGGQREPRQRGDGARRARRCHRRSSRAVDPKY